MVGGLDIGFDHLSAEMLKKKRQLDDASSASSPVSMIATTLTGGYTRESYSDQLRIA